MPLRNLWLPTLAQVPLLCQLVMLTTGSFTTGDFIINSSTGLVTAKTGRLDFENPNDTAGTAADNNYQITVVYTASDNKTYTETVNIEVTDDALTDSAQLQ